MPVLSMIGGKRSTSPYTGEGKWVFEVVAIGVHAARMSQLAP